jgi:simple sugar transport system permease protein
MLELFQSAILISIVAATLSTATAILFAAIGELVTERAGIWNMGVEGTMLMGCFVAYFVMSQTGSLTVAVLVAVFAGVIIGLIIAFMTVTLQVDHFVTGLGFNLLAGGLSLFWFRSYAGGRSSPRFDGMEPVSIPGLSDIPVLGDIFLSQYPLTYLAFAMFPLVWFFLYRTKFGLEVRAAGENPKVLDVKGLSVALRQYLAVIFGCCMTALGGAFLLLAFSDQFRPDISGGRGWLALVAIIAGNWMPSRILAAVLIFSLLDSIAVHAQAIGVNIPYQFLLMLPYAASIILMMGVRTRSGQPAGLGVPYLRR